MYIDRMSLLARRSRVLDNDCIDAIMTNDLPEYRSSRMPYVVPSAFQKVNRTIARISHEAGYMESDTTRAASATLSERGTAIKNSRKDIESKCRFSLRFRS